MANSSGLNRTGVLSRVTVAAITAALVGTTTAAVAADAPQERTASAAVQKPSGNASAFAAESTSDAQVNALYGVDSRGDMYGYAPNGEGGLDARVYTGYGWSNAKFITQVDQDHDGSADGIWDVTSGRLSYMAYGGDPIAIGSGWSIYNKVLSAGQLGGGTADDLLARDSYGVLWLYLGYGNGKVTTRYRVGGGWQAYSQIAGKGDLSGDGKDDIVARDSAGVLWLYKGTGSYTAPFAARTKIGGGWNAYNALVSTGDIDLDGITDLVARESNGALWLYKGTANGTVPFKPRVKIGTSGWNTYRLMF
ncbi:VCBS repeat-containing protein [Streptomyces sp. NK15101]|uniref:FG-GAP repeat domain-containing protein n=1 Tax=Streptomyces sp. NK15101 TaxID=2873261 RepID=UPI001CED2354|nr:VCBS repeat-containing protein [Streptomyces sp. NK15101]